MAPRAQTGACGKAAALSLLLVVVCLAVASANPGLTVGNDGRSLQQTNKPQQTTSQPKTVLAVRQVCKPCKLQGLGLGNCGLAGPPSPNRAGLAVCCSKPLPLPLDKTYTDGNALHKAVWTVQNDMLKNGCVTFHVAAATSMVQINGANPMASVVLPVTCTSKLTYSCTLAQTKVEVKGH